MDKHKKGIALTFIFVISLLASTAFVFADNNSSSYTQKDLNEQSVMALAWVQNSAEFRELCYQAYNMASMMVDKALAAKKWGDKPLAIIADADETVLDNSAYDAGLIGSDAAYSGKTWTEWENAAKARALPGAADFLQSLAKKGVEVFYVTNRDMAGLDGTIRNFKALGFPYADKKHVLVKTDTSNKQPRYDSVTKDYNVVCYLGDNANDLPIGTYHKSQQERNAIVDQHKAEFGTKFIALPNPVYGDWEGVLAKGYWGLSPKEKSKARKDTLYTWVP